MIVYLDVLFLVNAMINYCVLFLTAKIRCKVQVGRLLLAAVLGGLYAACMFYPDWSFCYRSVGRILSSVLLVVVAYHPKGWQDFWKDFASFYLVSFGLGGVLLACFFFFGSRMGGMLKNGILYFDLSLVSLAGYTVLGYVVLTGGAGLLTRLLSRNRVCVPVRIQIGGRGVEVMGLLDTGSHLCEPITRAPVIVMEQERLKELIPPHWMDPFSERLEGGGPSLCWIPYRVLGGSGVLLGFWPDDLEVDGKACRKSVIALYPHTLSADHSYGAILNPMVL